MLSRIQVPAMVKRNEAFEVRVLIQHPMETGFRRDAEGRAVTKNVINRLVCNVNGAEQFRAEMDSGVAANPYLQFFVVADRSGEIVALSDRDAWFAYPFWEDDRHAPDYARTVAIHNKPGYDPCELFFDPGLRFPKLRVSRRLLQKKLGFRTKFDVIPLDASIVKGSHGLVAADPQDGPLLVSDTKLSEDSIPMASVRDRILQALDLAD